MDPRLEKLNETWKELTEQASRLSRAAAQLKELESQYAERQQRVEETGAIYRKEQDDVDKLEQGGLRAFFIGLTGNMEERLSKERREAMAAKCQYDQAMSDLEYLDGKIRELRGQQEELKQVQQRLEALSQAKAKLLKELGGETGEQLMEMDRRQGGAGASAPGGAGGPFRRTAGGDLPEPGAGQPGQRRGLGHVGHVWGRHDLHHDET